MPRIPYVPADIDTPADLVGALRKRRGGELLDVDRMMLHSPALTAAWSGFFGNLKEGMAVPVQQRELIATVVGVINGAPYQIRQHGKAYLAAGGSPEKLQALHEPDRAQESGCFDALELTLIRLSLEMTRNVKVSDEVFAAARKALGSEQALVEAVGVAAGFNLVSRFLVALGVGED
jgi:alkylhydroperoxidase family enzyme